MVYSPQMSTSPEKRRVIVHVDLAQKAARDLLGGVLRYAALHEAWDVRIYRSHPMNIIPGALLKMRPHGIITDSQFPQPIVSRMVHNGLKGIIALHNDVSKGVPVRFIGCNNAIIGESGAEFLLSKKLHHFAYVPSAASDAELAVRQAAFCRRIADCGYSADVFTRKGRRKGLVQDETEELAQWLLSLPKPCGIMAAFDQRAKNVLDACIRAKIDVPSQCLVLGVDNEEYICENTHPSLSSILPDFTAGGMLAAETLENLMSGTDAPPAKILYGTRRIEERTSTMDISGAVRSIVLACEFMRRNAPLPIGIAEIVAASGTSKRLLEKHFRKVLNTTAMRELQRLRIELVKRRLEETTLPLKRVGESCGFNDEFHLKRTFKQQTGMTMSDYRRKFARPPLTLLPCDGRLLRH